MAAHGVVNPRVGSAFRKTTRTAQWPGGPRLLPCLGCDRVFRSQGRGNRLCGACRTSAAEDLPAGVTPTRAPAKRKAP